MITFPYNEFKAKVLRQIRDKKLHTTCRNHYNFKDSKRGEGIEILISAPTVNISTYQLFDYDEKTKLWSSSSTLTKSTIYLTRSQIADFKEAIGVSV